MPTVIDSLIVTLGLDPKNFTQGQKSAVASLQQLQQQAARTSVAVQRSGTGIVTFFNSAQHPVNALHQAFARLAVSTSTTAPLQTNLNRMAAQGRVTGAGIQAGALAGASGLRILGATGLAAFATFTALSKVLSEAKENAGNVFKTGIGASGAGMGVRGFSAISQALLKAGNAPEADTQAWLAQYRQWRLKLTTSQGDRSRLTPLAETQAGLRPYTDTGEEVLIKLARSFQDLADDEAIKRGGLAGLTDVQSIALKKAGANLPALTASETERATSPEEVKAAEDLLTSTNNLAIAWNKLSRIMWTELNPGIQKLADIIARIVGFLGPKENRELTRDESIISSFPGGAGFVAGRKIWNWLRGEKEGDTKQPPASGSKPATSAAPGKSGSYTLGQMKTLALNAGFVGAEADKAAAVWMIESSGNPNAHNTKGEDSYGLSQINARAHGPIAREALDPKRAAELAYMVYKKQGWDAWKNSLAGAEKYLKDGPIQALPLPGAVATKLPASMEPLGNGGWGAAIRTQRGSIILPPNKTNYTGEDHVSRPPKLPGEDDVAYMARNRNAGDLAALDIPRARGHTGNVDLIHRANAATRAARLAANNNTTNSSAVNIGDINVTTQAKDAVGTGDAVSNSLKQVIQSNSGLGG